MSACYSVTARIAVKDRHGASAVIRDYIHQHDGVDCDFALDDWRAEGISAYTFDGLMRILFAGWQDSEFNVRRESDFLIYSNGFNASYGWEVVMLDIVERLTPFLKPKSCISIWCDVGSHTIKV